MKIIAAELIIRYEIGDFDYLEERIKQVQRRYKNEFAKMDFEREKLVIKILLKLIYTQRIKSDAELVHDIKLLLSKATEEQALEDDVISYNEWISKKLL